MPCPERVGGVSGVPQDFNTVQLIPYEIDHEWVKGGVDGPCFQHVSRNPVPEAGQPDIQPLENRF